MCEGRRDSEGGGKGKMYDRLKEDVTELEEGERGIE